MVQRTTRDTILSKEVMGTTRDTILSNDCLKQGLNTVTAITVHNISISFSVPDHKKANEVLLILLPNPPFGCIH